MLKLERNAVSLRNLFFLFLMLMPSTGFPENTFRVTGTYNINGQLHPDLSLTRGETYTFIISVGVVHPFWIKSVQGTGTDNAYNNGVSINGITSGAIIFTVPENAPDFLYYNCKNHSTMTGIIRIIDSTG